MEGKDVFSDVLGERKFAELVCRKAGTSFSETELGKHDQDSKGIKQGGSECQQHWKSVATTAKRHPGTVG